MTTDDTARELAEAHATIARLADAAPKETTLAILDVMTDMACGTNPWLKDVMRLHLYREIIAHLAVPIALQELAMAKKALVNLDLRSPTVDAAGSTGQLSPPDLLVNLAVPIELRSEIEQLTKELASARTVIGQLEAEIEQLKGLVAHVRDERNGAAVKLREAMDSHELQQRAHDLTRKQVDHLYAKNLALEIEHRDFEARLAERDAAYVKIEELTALMLSQQNEIANVRDHRNRLQADLLAAQKALDELTKEPETLSKKSLDVLQELPVYSFDGTIKFPTS